MYLFESGKINFKSVKFTMNLLKDSEAGNYLRRGTQVTHQTLSLESTTACQQSHVSKQVKVKEVVLWEKEGTPPRWGFQ